MLGSKLKTFFFQINLKNSNYYSLLHDLIIIERFLRRNFSYTIKLKISCLTKNKKKISQLRAPFVHKVAQEHFILFFFKKKIKIYFFFNIFSFYLIYWVFYFLKCSLITKLSSFNRLNYFFNFF